MQKWDPYARHFFFRRDSLPEREEQTRKQKHREVSEGAFNLRAIPAYGKPFVHPDFHLLNISVMPERTSA